MNKYAMRINEEFLDNASQDELMVQTSATNNGGYDFIIYVILKHNTLSAKRVSSRTQAFLAKCPFISSLEPLDIAHEKNLDRIITASGDFEQPRLMTVNNEIPGSFAFGVFGNFRNNLRAAMNMF